MSRLEKMLEFHYAAAFRFDLARSSSEIESLRGIEPNALRSSFLSACERILSQGGVALAYGAASVACALGSSSPLDPELALFQFAKTLKRTLPFLAAEAFPEGSVAAFDPSSDRAVEELSRFLSA